MNDEPCSLRPWCEAASHPAWCRIWRAVDAHVRACGGKPAGNETADHLKEALTSWCELQCQAAVQRSEGRQLERELACHHVEHSIIPCIRRFVLACGGRLDYEATHPAVKALHAVQTAFEEALLDGMGQAVQAAVLKLEEKACPPKQKRGK